MNPTIADIFNTQEVINYVNDKNYDMQAGAALFPEVKQDSLEIKYLKGANGAPVSASVHAYNTESEIASREGAQEVSMKVALIKRKIGVDEQLLLQLNSLRQNSPQWTGIINSIYNDIDRMVNAVNVRIERMRYEALSTGKITLDENNVKYVIDYHFDENQKTTASTLWDASGADPIEDIYAWVDAMVQRTGTTPTRALTSRKVLAQLQKNEAVQKAVYGQNNARRVSINDLNTFLVGEGLPLLGTEDRVYRTQEADGTYKTHRYFSDNKIVLLPDGPIGRTVFAPTPEEIRLGQNPAVDTSMIGNILAMVYDESVDPVATYTKAVASCLPSFENADSIFTADVLSASI